MNPSKVLRFLSPLIWGFCLTVPALPQSESSSVSQETNWGTSLSDFKTAKSSKLNYSVDKMNARALDYLFMDFHEVDKDDPARAPKFSAQTVTGEDATYLFYDGKLCAVSKPLPLAGISDERKELDSRYKKGSDNLYIVMNVFSGDFGSKRAFFYYYGYAESPATQVYLVKVTSYYEDPSYYGGKGYTLVEAEQGELQAPMVWF